MCALITVAYLTVLTSPAMYKDISNQSICLFCRLYLEQGDFHDSVTGDDVCMDRSSESVTCQTFELTLRSCLYPHIDKQYLECCGNLMQTLKKDYR